MVDPAAQPGGVAPQGITLTLPAPVDLSTGQQVRSDVVIRADSSAADTGELVLSLRSTEGGTTELGRVRINYRFSEAVAALRYTPNFVETGTVQGGSIVETVTLENIGLAVMENVQLALITEAGGQAPAWINLSSASNAGDLGIGESHEVAISIAPPENLADGIYTHYLRVTSDNVATADIGIFASVTQSGMGNALFKVSDIYTATLDESGAVIEGLENARVRVQNENVISVEETLTTDASGEVLFMDLPAGYYRFRASASNHEDLSGRFQIKPGITVAEEIFLDYNLVSVEWSVSEVTIDDVYNITLTATYETDVPAAVVVAEPTGINLPGLQEGDIFNGEFTLTNYGLIRADNLVTALPAADEFMRYELLGGLPESLGAKERITVAYRAIALSDLGADGSGSGGGCYTYTRCFDTRYVYQCANDVVADGNTPYCVTRAEGSTCSTEPTGEIATSISGGTGGTGSVGGNTGPTYTTIGPSTACAPDSQNTCPLKGENGPGR